MDSLHQKLAADFADIQRLRVSSDVKQDIVLKILEGKTLPQAIGAAIAEEKRDKHRRGITRAHSTRFGHRFRS